MCFKCATSELGKLHETLESWSEWLARIPDNPMRLRGLREALRQAEEEANFAAAAATHLVMGSPLAETFPNGGPRPALPTPRQIVYLAGLAQAEERHAREDREPRPGVPEPRRCEGVRTNGLQCGGWSLRWIDRPMCRHHATDEEREANQAAKKAWEAEVAAWADSTGDQLDNVVPIRREGFAS